MGHTATVYVTEHMPQELKRGVGRVAVLIGVQTLEEGVEKSIVKSHRNT